MIKLYAQLNESNDSVLSISTVSFMDLNTEIYLDDEALKVDKLPGYTVTTQDTVYHMSFDEEKYNTYISEQKKQKATEEGQKLLEELTKKNLQDSSLKSASDEDAYTMRYLYDEWQPKTKYLVGDRRRYDDNLYKCKQEHTSEEGPNRTPDYLPALWDLVAPDDPTLGTKDNPIIIPELFSSMEYIKGKYYKEGDVLYLMNRQGMEDGETVSLAYKPSALIGHYFAVVEEE